MYLNHKRLSGVILPQLSVASGQGEVQNPNHIPDLNNYESPITQLHQRQLNQGFKLSLKPLAGNSTDRMDKGRPKHHCQYTVAAAAGQVGHSYRTNIQPSKLYKEDSSFDIPSKTTLLLMEQQRFASQRQYSDIFYSQTGSKQQASGRITDKLMKKQEYGMLSERILANTNSTSTIQTTNAPSTQRPAKDLGPYQLSVASPKNVDATISSLLEPTQKNFQPIIRRNKFNVIGECETHPGQKQESSLTSIQNKDLSKINFSGFSSKLDLKLKFPQMTRSRVREKTELDYPNTKGANSVDSSIQHTSRSVLLENQADKHTVGANDESYRSKSVIKPGKQNLTSIEKLIRRAQNLRSTLMSKDESKQTIVSIVDQEEKKSPRIIQVDEQDKPSQIRSQLKVSQAKITNVESVIQGQTRRRHQKSLKSPRQLSERVRDTRNASNQRGFQRDYVPTWETDQKQGLFPVKKFDIMQFIKQSDSNQITKQIDGVIDSKLLSHYTFQEATFRHIEKTVNFDSKLEQIDQIIKSELMDGTLESIAPQYIHQVDPLKRPGVKRMKLTKVDDYALRDKIKHIGMTYDHQGNILTMNGSKYKNWDEMKRVRTLRDIERRNQEEYDGQVAVLNLKEGSALTSPKTSPFQSPKEKKSPFNRKQNKRGTDQALKIDHEPIIKVGQKLLDQISRYFKKRVQRAFDQEKYLKVFQNFHDILQHQLNDDKVFEDILREAEHLGGNFEAQIQQLPDEILEQRFFDSGYNETFKEQILRVKDIEKKQIIASEMTGSKVGTKVLKRNALLQANVNQIVEKLAYVEHFKRANYAIDHMLQQKRDPKRWSLENVDQERMDSIMEDVKQELKKMQRQYQQTVQSREEEQKQIIADIQVPLEDAVQFYLQQCLQEKCAPLMIGKRFADKTLIIKREQLNQAQCRALANSLDKFIPHHFDSIILNDNNLDDECLTVILQEIARVPKQVRRLDITDSNHIGNNSTLMLIKVLQKEYPKQVQELSLNCAHLSKLNLFKILDALKHQQHGQGTHIKQLSLSQQELDSDSMTLLSEIIQSSQNLEKLNLNYCRFHAKDSVINFLDAVCCGSSLQYLDLSFNPSQNTSLYSQALTKFISSSKNLMHLNLSGCDIYQESDVLPIFQAIRKSKSLQAVHFSGNQITPAVATKIRDVLRIREVQRNDQATEETLYTTEETQQDEEEIQVERKRRQTMANNNAPKAARRPTIVPKKIKKEMRGQERLIAHADTYIFSRILGHLEIKQGHRWVEREVCWICEKWRYVFFIWSEMIGDNLYESTQLKQNSELDSEFSGLHALEPLVRFSGAEKTVCMLQMSEFLERLDRNQRPHQRMVIKKEETIRMQELEQLKQARQVQGMALVKSLNKQLIINKASDHNIANQLKIMQKITKKEEWRTIYQVNRLWPILIGKHLKVFVKDAQTIITLNSVEELKPKANEIFFAFADYFSPTSQKDLTVSIYFSHSRPKHVYQKTISITPRSTDPLPMLKRTKKSRIDRLFSLKSSVFGQWAVDIDEEYKKCFEADMKYSKIDRFLKRGTDQFNFVADYLLRNYAKIFEVYLFCSGRSNYPSIQWIDFTDTCQAQWKMIDKNLSISTVDRLFIAVNFEGVPGGLDDNPDKELCRYEFFEILVRMAIAKYPQLTSVEALRKIMDENILSDPNCLSWWKFRQELIWTLEVDDLLKANLHICKKLYQSVLTSIKKQYHIEDAVQMVSHSGLKLSDKDSTLAFSYSKFPVTDEMEDISKVQQLNFNEFLEFLCRLGQIKYQDSQLSLFDKVLRVMTELFKLIGERPILPQNNDMDETESDYDEFDDLEPEKLEEEKAEELEILDQQLNNVVAKPRPRISAVGPMFDFIRKIKLKKSQVGAAGPNAEQGVTQQLFQ